MYSREGVLNQVEYCVAMTAPVAGDMLPTKALLLPMVARMQYHQEQQGAPQRNFPGGASDER